MESRKMAKAPVQKAARKAVAKNLATAPKKAVRRAKPAAARTPVTKSKPAARKAKPAVSKAKSAPATLASKTSHAAASAAPVAAAAVPSVTETETVKAQIPAQVPAQVPTQVPAVIATPVEEGAKEFFFSAHYDSRELAQEGKHTLDACVKSSRALADGAGSLGKEISDFAQEAIKANFAFAASLVSARTPQEVLDLQAEHSYAAFDGLLAESGRLAKISMATTEKAVAPLQDRASEVVERFFG